MRHALILVVLQSDYFRGGTFVQKDFPDAFRAARLEQEVRAAAIEHVVIVGAMRHVCIDATLRAVPEAGFQCTVMA